MIDLLTISLLNTSSKDFIGGRIGRERPASKAQNLLCTFQFLEALKLLLGVADVRYPIRSEVAERKVNVRVMIGVDFRDIH